MSLGKNKNKNRKKCQIISPSIASHFLSPNFTLEHPFSLSKSSTLKIWKSKLNLISWPKKRNFLFQWIGLFEASSDRTHKVEGIRASQVKNSSHLPLVRMLDPFSHAVHLNPINLHIYKLVRILSPNRYELPNWLTH